MLRAILDGDAGARRRGGIDGAPGRDDVEGDLTPGPSPLLWRGELFSRGETCGSHGRRLDQVGAGVRGEGEGVGADLVGDVAVGGDAVGADDDGVHEAAGDDTGGGAIDDDLVRDAFRGQLPRGQARALEERAGLIDEDAGDLALPVGGLDDAEGGTDAAGRESAGVAVGEEGGAIGDERGAELAHALIGRDLLLVDADGLGFGVGRREDAVQRPAEIDGGRARSGELLGRRAEVAALAVRQREGVGSGDADEGRAAEGEAPDCGGDIVGIARLDVVQRGGQPRLVDEAEDAVAPLDGVYAVVRIFRRQKNFSSVGEASRILSSFSPERVGFGTRLRGLPGFVGPIPPPLSMSPYSVVAGIVEGG